MVESCCQTLGKRLKEIRAMRKQYEWFYVALVFILVFAIGVSVGVRIGQIHYGGPSSQADVFIEGAGIVVAEGVSVIVTIFVVNRWYAKRQVSSLQHQLVREVGSGSNEFAKNAVSRLRAEGWLEGDDGLLKGEDLNNANLQGANLTRANLQGTKLVKANFEDANLFQVNLRGSSLFGANLRKAQLQGADLSNTNLRSADLRDAKMRYFHIQEMEEIGLDLLNAKPQRANLNGADLAGAYLEGATLTDEENLVDVLEWPDCKQYGGIGLLEELKKFTDVDHREFDQTLEKVKLERKHQRYVGEPRAFSDPEDR